MTKPIPTPWILGIAALALGILGMFFTVAPRGDEGLDFTAPMIPGGWMAWTLATALFFWIIGCLLITLTILAINHPETPRLGVLRIETTRGDRLFISLLGSAFICIAWMFTLGPPLWWALALCLIYAAAVFRWV
jgi:predicted small integral membrane protein